MSDPTPSVDVILTDPAFREDPYPTYAALRSSTPVVWLRNHGFWLLTRHQDVSAALADNRFGHGEDRTAPGETAKTLSGETPLERSAEHWVLFKNRPDHKHIRQPLSRAFARLSEGAIRDCVQRCLDQLLRRLDDEGGPVEIVDSLARPLPMRTILSLLGVPPQEVESVSERAHPIFGVLDFETTTRSLAIANSWVTELEGFFQDLIARGAVVEHSIIGDLLRAVDEGHDLQLEEVVANSALMLFAGYDTTVQAIAGGLWVLLQRPDALGRLAKDPDRIPLAVDELLRFESPQQLAFRHALEDVEIAGIPIRGGEKLCLSLGAANRDPEVFRDPDRFIPDRTPNHHLAFARGIHHCVGWRLAHEEMCVFLSTMLERFPRMQLVDHEIASTVLIRGLRRLLIHLDP